jgi:chromosomal replication initiator protein
MLVTDPSGLWTSCSDLLRQQVSDATWLTWFEAIRPIKVDTEALVLAVPSSLVKERIEGRYLEMVRGALLDVSGRDTPIRLEVHTAPVEAGPSERAGLLSESAWNRPTISPSAAEP